MNIRTMCKLRKEGFDESWLLNIKENWKPRKFGTYLLRITYIEDLCGEPDDGIFIDNTCFSTKDDLIEILSFFEGLAYVLSDTATETRLSSGIIDDSLFDEVEVEEW